MAAEKKSAKIIEEKLPDLEVVQPVQAPQADNTGYSAAAESTRGTKPGASIGELRRKYLGAAADATDAMDAPREVDEVDVVQVRPKASAAPADPANDPGLRTVVISKKKNQIVGEQG